MLHREQGSRVGISWTSVVRAEVVLDRVRQQHVQIRDDVAAIDGEVVVQCLARAAEVLLVEKEDEAQPPVHATRRE